MVATEDQAAAAAIWVALGELEQRTRDTTAEHNKETWRLTTRPPVVVVLRQLALTATVLAALPVVMACRRPLLVRP
jgi:hypothetical protein